MPDTPENDQAFGRTKNATGLSPFPQARIVALAECPTHAIVGAAIGTAHDGEATLALQVVDRVDPDMLVIVDRGLPGLPLLAAITSRGAQCLFRVTSQFKLPVLEVLPDGSYISVLLERNKIHAHETFERQARHDLPAAITYLRDAGTACRVIEYRVEGSDTTFRLITSILNPDIASAHELAALYHQRWEIELIFDELEIHQTGHLRVLRSKSPALVRQEIWGLLLTHYAIRDFMHEAAQHAEVDDHRISFLNALRIVRHHLTATAGLSPLQQ